MNIRVYSAPTGYLLVDGFTSAPWCVPPAQLVFSIASDRLPIAVAQMLEGAFAETGTIELRETWANHLFRDYPEWDRHHRPVSELVG